MGNLTEIQAFRAAVVGAVDFDVKKAKEVCDFVLESDKPTSTMNINVKPTSDGIYYVMNDKTLVPVENIDLIKKEAVVGVAVKAMGHVATVALHDAANGKDVALIDEDKECPETPEAYRKSFKAAIADWDGKGNTDRLRPYLNPEIELKDNEYIPSVAQLHFILLFVNEVNKALVAVGGDELQAGSHWSSSEYSSYYSWYVYFYDGITFGNFKCSYLAVRPSVACEA